MRIGNAEATLKKNYSEGDFMLNNDTGRLEFQPKKKTMGMAMVEQL